MSSMPLEVSIIIPVYNAMPYLRRCLDSVIAQTRADFEVICVDDASTDDGTAYIERLAFEHPQIRLVRQEVNRGVSAARNVGLDQAHGRYILFVDGDDFLDSRLLEMAVEKAERLSAQMTVYGYDEYYEGRESFVPLPVFDAPDLVDRAFSLKDMEMPSTELTTPNVWRILYERSFIEGLGVRFHEDLKTAEDLAFIYETLPYAGRVAAVPERLYHYRRDGGSTLTRGDRGLSGFRALAYARDRLADEATGLSEADARLEADNRHETDVRHEAAIRHFTNVVLDTADYAMWSASTCNEYCDLHECFVGEWLPYVEARRSYVAPRYQPFFHDMQTQTAIEHLFGLYTAWRHSFEDEHAAVSQRDAELREARDHERMAQEEVGRVRSSWAFRVGRAITFLPSKARAVLSSHRG